MCNHVVESVGCALALQAYIIIYHSENRPKIRYLLDLVYYLSNAYDTKLYGNGPVSLRSVALIKKGTLQHDRMRDRMFRERSCCFSKFLR